MAEQSTGESSILVHRADSCVYTSCYCEENIWKLCESVKEMYGEAFAKCYVVFLSNEQRAIPLWKQKNAKGEDKPLIWDYHVIFLYREDKQCWVFDLDTRLPFPCTFEQYSKEALGTETHIHEFRRLFRVAKAQEYLDHFASDRRHMLKADGTWMAKPPDYRPITTNESTHNIDSWISMDSLSGWGRVMDLKTFCAYFSNDEDTFTKLPNLL